LSLLFIFVNIVIMKHKFNHIQFIKKIISFSPRQLEGENKTAEFIIQFLKERGIKSYCHNFTVKIPKTIKAKLIVDGENIFCKNTGFIGGKIKGKNNILSSLISSNFSCDLSNINFNPNCSDNISLCTFYFAPSVAVHRNSIPVILKGEKVEGETIVTSVKHKAANILVGNRKNPRVICFTHYDSIELGVIDNASGVSVMTEAIIENPKSLDDVLYVYSAVEEISYDNPTYWGYGFRQFEKKYFQMMMKTEKIVVVDSLGNGNPRIVKDPELLNLGFPIVNLKKWSDKIIFISGDIDKLMNVYHSDADNISQINSDYLKKGTKMLMKKVSIN